MDLFKTKNNIDSIKFDLLDDKYNSMFDEKFINYQDVLEFFQNNNGASYDKGIFKIHNKSSCFYWTSIVSDFFPKYKDNICCFAFDWMGRHFAVDLKQSKKCYMFDPATGEDFEIEQSLAGFFNEELVEYRDETLACDDFNFVLDRLKLDILLPDKCIGYKKLLFLGGEDDLKNTEVIDMDIYWDLNFKIFSKISKMNDGDIIDNIDYL